MNSILRAVAAAFLFFAIATPSQASLTLRFTDLVSLSTVTVTDNGAGDLNPAVDSIFYTGTIGSWTSTGTVGLSNFLADILDVLPAFNSSGPGALKVEISNTNYNFGGATVAFEHAIGGSTQGVVTTQGWLDPANVLFGHGGVSLSMGPIGGTPFSTFAYSSAIANNGPFSLTEEVIIKHTDAGRSVFDFAQTAVPEPGTLAMSISALGLFALVGMSRRIRRS